MPFVPPGTGMQKLVSTFAPAFMAGLRPEIRAGLICSPNRLASLPDGAPLYARDCARLI